jgi:hypothetical protein
MAYYIFLKSLRSLEEFRKNPHVKIPAKSPCANFQSLGKLKNPIFNSKFSFLRFRPGQHCGPLGFGPAGPTGLSPLLQAKAHRLAEAARPTRAVGVIAEVCFPFWLAPFELAASFSSLCQVGLGCQICLPPPPADRCHFLSSTTSDLEMSGEVFTPRLDSPP